MEEAPVFDTLAGGKAALGIQPSRDALFDDRDLDPDARDDRDLDPDAHGAEATCFIAYSTAR